MAIMGIMERCTFSETGQYFACYSDDGKLRVWETGTGKLTQDYTPNFHLGFPGTCIEWIKFSLETISSKKKKKKIKQLDEHDTDVIAIGTSSGSILLYSIASGDVVATLEGGPTSSVNCLSWCRGTNLFSCADEMVVEWGVGSQTIKSTWKAGRDVVKHLLVLPDGDFILTASRSITLWSLPKHERLKTYSGHASDVSAMVFIPPVNSTSESYFVSAGAADRYLSAWSLSGENYKSPVAQFLMEDVAVLVGVCQGDQTGSTTMCAVARSGVSYFYKLQLNGKCTKPIKPKLTVQIAADTSKAENKETIMPIPIVGALVCSPSTVLLAHGVMPLLTFEKISPSWAEPVLFLVREDLRAAPAGQQRKGAYAKQLAPEVGEDVQYVSSLTGPSTSKRGHKVHCEVPMEERLNNLTLNRDVAGAGVPHADNVAHLLLQGLRSKDRRIVQTVLQQRDMAVIKRTVARLPVQVVVLLVQELAVLIQGKVVRCQVAAQWLRAVIGTHASQILASPGVAECFAPVLGLVQTRLDMLVPLSRLRGRLDLLMDQLSAANTKSPQLAGDSLLVYQDSYSSDEDSVSVVDDKTVQSDSDEIWNDLSESEESEMQDGELDAEMSVE